MGDVAIKVKNLSKLYQLGQIGTGTLSRDLNRWWANVRGKEDPYAKIGQVNDRTKKAETEFVWALKDINFEVKQGEVLGVIGRNGAGKSTLLKILSRITTPTSGKIYTKGRIASLLEVGTGFHPEMTGRENIFMNGAILGMRRWEIQEKFDEIVNFSGVEAYIDTPVKRYSSGMYVRLAFAVAAFLDPEILIIDEVLSVGDTEFQNKCLGRIQEVSQLSGKTILFVSHNLASIKKLCEQGLLIDNGKIVLYGDIMNVIDEYYSLVKKSSLQLYKNSINILNNSDPIFKLVEIRVLQDGKELSSYDNAYDIKFEITYIITQKIQGFKLNLMLLDNNDNIVSQLFSHEENIGGVDIESGFYKTEFVISGDSLVARKLIFKLSASIHSVRLLMAEAIMNIELNDSGKYRRIHYPENYKGLVTIPFRALTYQIL